MKVLIADDSDVIRERLSRMLSSLKIEKYESDSVAGTLSMLEKNNPDILLLDIHFPDGTGIELLQTMRKKRLKPLTIILTNYSSKTYKEECMAAGADYFFDKSKEFLRIKKVIKQIIN